jgi:co-chaperonin GroES (HSP10)
MSKTKPESGETDDAPSVITQAPKVSRHIRPLGPRVLVRVLKQEDRSEAGLFLPAGVKDAHAAALFGEVVEVARTMPSDDGSTLTEDGDGDDGDEQRPSLGTNVSGVPLGANVLFEKDRGVVVPWDESLRILEVRYVLAIVDVIPQEEIQ